MKANTNTAEQSNKIQVTEPYIVFGLVFASKQVVTDFLLASFFVGIVPLLLVVIGHFHFKNAQGMSEMQKVAYTVIPAVVFMNIVIGYYIYRVIKDPQNYKKDPPFVVRPKKE